MRTTLVGPITTHFVIKATADTAGWTITYPGREPIPMHARTDADSVIMDAGPYPSTRIKGAQVTVRSVAHLQDGKIVGTTVAHYKAFVYTHTKNLTREPSAPSYKVAPSPHLPRRCRCPAARRSIATVRRRRGNAGSPRPRDGGIVASAVMGRCLCSKSTGERASWTGGRADAYR